MRTQTDGAEGAQKTHRGAVDAPSLLNAVGKACLQFGVRTDQITALTVELVEAES